MKIYSMKECEQWIKRKVYYPLGIKVLVFEPEINGALAANMHVADTATKDFQHSLNQIIASVELIRQQYPQLNKILENLIIFMCPKPSSDTANACATGNYICYFARCTQIPWCMTKYITAHELGHVVEANLCNRRHSDSRFREYLELRGAEKGSCNICVDYDEKTHENIYIQKEDFLYLMGTYPEKSQYNDWDKNPAEWFAEDFRYLFSPADGIKYWGLPIPKPTKKIKDFMLSLKLEV